jgi:hypothetical protein
LIDRWHNKCAMYSTFSKLYSITINPSIIVATMFSNDELYLDFKRQIVGIYLIEWDQILSNLVDIIFHPTTYISIWRWSGSCQFYVHSLYEWLEFDGIINHEYDIV